MKIICVGRNYVDHIEELNNEKPQEPVIFLKPDTSVFNSSNKFYIPEFTESLHYECELILKIGKNGKSIPENFALSYISEVSLGIDWTARDLQNNLKQKGLPWELAKAFDNSAIIGEWQKFEPSDLEDLLTKGIEFTLRKNEEIVQNGNTKLMLYSIPELISFISKFFTLRQGDIIFTGTPKGVGNTNSGDIFTGELFNKQVLSLKIH